MLFHVPHFHHHPQHETQIVIPAPSPQCPRKVVVTKDIIQCHDIGTGHNAHCKEVIESDVQYSCVKVKQ